MISISNASKLYKTNCTTISALDNISLDIAEGELCAIVGDSGSGKSTLMNILGCLDIPTSGSYKLFGRDVASLSQNELSAIRRSEIGFIFQGFNLLTNMTALENVALPLSFARVPKNERVVRAREALSRVGLSERENHRPSQMSGGQQQRVAIARALAGSPRLILADEPTGNLDPASANDIINLLFSANSDGCTVVLITHDLALAERFNRKIRISNGRIVSDSIKEA